jgi:hypothetical protein
VGPVAKNVSSTAANTKPFKIRFIIPLLVLKNG